MPKKGAKTDLKRSSKGHFQPKTIKPPVDSQAIDPFTGETVDVVSDPDSPVTGDTQSLSLAAQEAFAAVGGAKWLKKQAREYPKEFMSLMARMAGDDTTLSGMSYIAVPIPVEQRELSDKVLEPLKEIDPLL